MTKKIHSISEAIEKSASVVDQEDQDSCQSVYLEMCAHQMQLAIIEATDEIDLISQILMTALTSDTDSSADVLTELIVKLQFNDRMKQRLSNVRINIQRLARYFNSEQTDENRSAWIMLLRETRESFTMESERVLFDEALGDVLRAAELEEPDSIEPGSDNKIELFR